MGNRIKLTSLRGIFRLTLMGSVVITKASASFAAFVQIPESNPVPDWQALRGEFEEALGEGDGLPKELVRFVEMANLTSGFEDTVRLSYSMVPLHLVEALDRLWVDTLIARASSPVVTEFMSIRAAIDTVAAQDREYYLEHWVWRTQAGDGSQGS